MLNSAIKYYDSAIGCAKCRKWPWDQININSDDGVFDGIITLKVRNASFLKELTTKLEKIKAITSITRTYKHN